MRRRDSAVPLEKNEVLCLALNYYWNELSVYYLCLDKVDKPDSFKIIFLSHESEIVTCTTQLILEYDTGNNTTTMTIDKSGFLNPNNYGFLVHKLIDMTYIKTTVQTFVNDFFIETDSFMKNIET